MKKFLMVLSTMVIFSFAEALLDTLLGIKFPSFWAGVLHNVLLMMNGAVLMTVLKAKI